VRRLTLNETCILKKHLARPSCSVLQCFEQSEAQIDTVVKVEFPVHVELQSNIIVGIELLFPISVTRSGPRLAPKYLTAFSAVLKLLCALDTSR
jgi:hypothetical protein